MMEDDLTTHAERNRAYWSTRKLDQRELATRAWAQSAPTWGETGIGEDIAGMFSPHGDPSGKRIIELGCGTGYVSGWLARRGAVMTAVDVTPSQLEIARDLQRQHDVSAIEFVEASAESLPVPDGSFDAAISEYGACLWCDPDLWLAEAARVLRPGGTLSFLTNSLLMVLCDPYDNPESSRVDGRLARPLRGMRGLDWADSEGSFEFHLPHGDMVRTLDRHGFEVTGLRELYACDGARPEAARVTAAWRDDWPIEEVWTARLRA